MLEVFETFSALQAEIENTVRRERAMRGMDAKMAAGIYPWKPPIGYRSAQNRSKGLKKTEPDEPDGERFPLIERLFRVCLEERVCGTAELARRAKQWELRTAKGRELSAKRISEILSNRFYAGIIVNPWSHEEIEGRHRRMISPSEFDEVQWLRRGGHVRLHQARKRREHPDFPLRRAVQCGVCGTLLTGSWSRGNGGRYAYYHCRNTSCDMYGKGIPRSVLEADFSENLRAVTPCPNTLEIFKAAVLEIWQAQGSQAEQAMRRQQARLLELKQQVDGLIAMKIRDLLSDDEFLERKEALKLEIAETEAMLRHTAEARIDLPRVIDQAVNTILDFPGTWLNMKPLRAHPERS